MPGSIQFMKQKQHHNPSRLLRLFTTEKIEITDPIVLATHTTEGTGSSTQHFCLINNQKTEVKTAAQLNNNRLYFQGSKITDPIVLATHTTEGRGSSTQHFCLINNQQTEVNTARQRYNRKEAPSNTPLKKRPKISCESEVHEGIYTGVIKQEPSAFLPWLSLPPLTVKELQEVAHILRGNSVADDNCAKYAMAFMEYFSTRILPHGPVPSEPSTCDDLAVYVKTEGNHITRSEIIREHRFFPCNQVPINNAEGRIDVDHLQWADEVDYFVQPYCDIQCLEKTLQAYATANEKQEAYGMLNFAHSINNAGIAGHSMNYYATPTKVYLIDCQLIHAGKGEAVFPIQEITHYYCFEGDTSQQKDPQLVTFQNRVFITPHRNTSHDSQQTPPLSEKQRTTFGIFGKRRGVPPLTKAAQPNPPAQVSHFAKKFSH